MIILIAGAAFFYSAYTKKTTAPEVPTEFQDDRAVNLFYEQGCVTCHWVSALPDARGKLGPGLDNVGDRARTYDPENNGETYLRESILEPAKVVRRGFINGMPSFEGKLTEQELTVLVSWLQSLKKSGVEREEKS